LQSRLLALQAINAIMHLLDMVNLNEKRTSPAAIGETRCPQDPRRRTSTAQIRLRFLIFTPAASSLSRSSGNPDFTVKSSFALLACRRFHSLLPPFR